MLARDLPVFRRSAHSRSSPPRAASRRTRPGLRPAAAWPGQPCRIRSCARRRPGCDLTRLARPRPGRWGAGAGGHRRGPQCVFLHLQSPLAGVGRRTLCRRHDQPRFLRHLSERHRRPTGICGRTLPLRRHPPVVHPAAGRQAGLERSRASGLQHPAAGQGDRSAGGQSQGDPQILAYRASRRYPLVIEVRVSHHEALASWRIEVRNLAIAAGWRWSSWRWWRSCCIATTCEGQGTGARTPRQRTGSAGLRRILRRHLHCRRRAAHRARQSGVLRDHRLHRERGNRTNASRALQLWR